jgi:hypothetical protein
MVAVPDEIPLTIPVLPTVAIAVLLLLHVPPVVVLAKVVEAPAHAPAFPVIALGKTFTVTIFVTLHPVVSIYVIVAVPATRPFTTPVDEPIVATVVLLLDHIPPSVVLLKLVVSPIQTLAVPDIAEGCGFTVTTVFLKQPVGNV